MVSYFGQDLGESLATMWSIWDPVPTGLAERVLVRLAAADVDYEYALLALTSRETTLAGARAPDQVLTFSFESEDLSMVIRVSEVGDGKCRIDGWVSPARSMTVSVVQGGVTQQVRVEDAGRFEFPEVPSGPARFLLHPDTASTHHITPAVDL